MKKRKIIFTDGCIVSNLAIDGKDAEELEGMELQSIVHKVVDSISSKSDLESLLTDMCQMFGEYKYCYHCEDCGDDVVEYRLTIEER